MDVLSAEDKSNRPEIRVVAIRLDSVKEDPARHALSNVRQNCQIVQEGLNSLRRTPALQLEDNMQTDSLLYRRLGGYDVIAAFVDSLLEMLRQDRGSVALVWAGALILIGVRAS